ncbi:MAG: hypothetical protein AAFY11_12985 [Cyanobacteria bacterium J06641_5]
MLIAILVFDIALVAWAIHLLEASVRDREFSLMLAGGLVGMSATAILAAYFLLGNCLQYLQ